jgi:hypothetical protein
VSDGVTPVTQYIIVIKEAGKKKFKKAAKVSADQLTCRITVGIDENTEYDLRVYAENEVIGCAVYILKNHFLRHIFNVYAHR